jgi:predicted ester cyclase
MSLEENKTLARRFLEKVNLEGMAPAELCTPDFTAHVASDPPTDLEAFQKFTGLFFAGFSEWILTVEDIVAEGDKVAFRLMTRATHTAEFMGIPATGSQVSLSNIGLGRIAGGKIAEWWVSPDRMGLFRQLGSMPKQS